MANNRIFYACQAVGIKPCYLADEITVVHGAQSVGISTSFNLESAFELGMIQVYEQIEGLPDVEISMEKVLDGYPLLYHLATASANGTSLLARSKAKSCVSLGIYSDENDVVSGVAPVEVYCSGLYFSSVSYTLPVEGNCTESVTLVGNHKEWFQSNDPNPVGFDGTLTPSLIAEYQMNPDGTGGDFPLALDNGGEYLGGIQRRENVRVDLSILPKSLFGVKQNSNAGNAYEGTFGAGGYPLVHMQNISISTDAGREDINELGRRAPYARVPNFPVDVTCDIEYISVSGDFVPAYEEGRPEYVGTADQGNNTVDETIRIHLNDYTCFDLGTRNRLSSVQLSGGDAGGGNQTITQSYTNQNDLKVLHPEDPALDKYSTAERTLIGL